MTEPGELIESADYAFAFRRSVTGDTTPRALVVLLHGVGGDEHQLDALAARLPSDALVVLPRGHRSISGGKWGWYRVGFTADGPQPVVDELHEARERLADFLAQLQQHHAVAADRTWVGGFSQGGILSAAVALTVPDRVAGFAMLSGRLLPEIEPLLAPGERLRRLEALIVHGTDDEVLPVQGARDAADRLAELGVRHELRIHDGRHRIGSAMADDAVRWLSSRITAGA